MPFDGTDNTPAVNRARLIEALRAEMPEDHVWAFSTVYRKRGCGTMGCAIGLGIRIGLPIQLWRNPGDWIITPLELAEVFGITPEQAHAVFLSPRTYGAKLHEVTPAMVADALERLS